MSYLNVSAVTLGFIETENGGQVQEAVEHDQRQRQQPIDDQELAQQSLEPDQQQENEYQEDVVEDIDPTITDEPGEHQMIEGKVICLECISRNSADKKVYCDSTGGSSLKRHLEVDHTITKQSVVPSNILSKAVVKEVKQQMMSRTIGQHAIDSARPIPQSGTRRKVKTQSQNPISMFAMEHVVLVEANIDDLTPKVQQYLTSRLLVLGALEASYLPVLINKGTCAVRLQLVCPQEAIEACIEELFMFWYLFLALCDALEYGQRYLSLSHGCLMMAVEQFQLGILLPPVIPSAGVPGAAGS